MPTYITKCISGGKQVAYFTNCKIHFGSMQIYCTVQIEIYIYVLFCLMGLFKMQGHVFWYCVTVAYCHQAFLPTPIYLRDDSNPSENKSDPGTKMSTTLKKMSLISIFFILFYFFVENVYTF